MNAIEDLLAVDLLELSLRARKGTCKPRLGGKSFRGNVLCESFCQPQRPAPPGIETVHDGMGRLVAEEFYVSIFVRDGAKKKLLLVSEARKATGKIIGFLKRSPGNLVRENKDVRLLPTEFGQIDLHRLCDKEERALYIAENRFGIGMVDVVNDKARSFGVFPRVSLEDGATV